MTSPMKMSIRKVNKAAIEARYGNPVMTHAVDTADLVEEYKRSSLTEIANRHRMSAQCVWERLKAAGVKMRPQGHRIGPYHNPRFKEVTPMK